MNESHTTMRGRISSIAAPSFIHDHVPYFTFSLLPLPEGPGIPENPVFYVDPGMPNGQAVVSIVCTAYLARAEIEIVSGPELNGMAVKVVQVSKPPEKHTVD
jgi:hypothetical protein